MARVIILVLDSMGVGYMDDVKVNRTQDIGANTLYNVIDKSENIKIPNLEYLGINSVAKHPKLKLVDGKASYGKLNLSHYGADSYSGHQEIMGTIPPKPFIAPFKEYASSVGEALISKGYKVEIPDCDNPYLLVNDSVIVADNIETDYGQIFNVSTTFEETSYNQLLDIGRIVRDNVKVNRVIALGGEKVPLSHLLSCIEKRDDGLIGLNSPKSRVYEVGYNCLHMGYGVNYKEQISTIAIESGLDVHLIGKMQDVIYCEGAKYIPAVETKLVMESIIASMNSIKSGIISATVQETDLAGHSQDVKKYADKMMEVDSYLGTIIEEMKTDDLLIITGDHGNDPTIGHSQHTREKTLLLAFSKSLKENINIGERKTLADISATASEFLNIAKPRDGESFLSYI